MSLTADIYLAFAEDVAQFAAAQNPVLTVAYPGVPFTPPSTTPWLELIPNWNGNDNYSLEDEGASIETGFFRLNVVGRPSVSVYALLLLAELIVTQFRKGTTFSEARVDAQPSIGGFFTEDDRTTAPVTIRWRATRTAV